MNFNKIKRLAASKLRDEKGKTKEWVQWYENQQGKPYDDGDEVIGPEKFNEVKLKIVDIWERPWESVAAYKDVPRLASRFHVIGEDGQRLDPNIGDVPSPRLGRKGHTVYQQMKDRMEANGEAVPFEGLLRTSQPGAAFAIKAEGEETQADIQMRAQAYSKKRETLKGVFLSLCALEDENEGNREALRQRIEDNFDEYYKEGCDFSQMSQMFMGQIIGGETRIIRALKATNQSIIAPAVIALSFSKLGQTYRYKDRKLWRVLLHITPDAVVITNQRGEQAVVPPDSAEFFEFTWELMIVFNRDVTEIVDVRINVVDVVYSDKATDAFKDKLEQMLGSLYNSGETVESYLERRRAQIEMELRGLTKEEGEEDPGEEENGYSGEDDGKEGEEQEEKATDTSESGSEHSDESDSEGSRKSNRRAGKASKSDGTRRKPKPINLANATGKEYVAQLLQYVDQENSRLDDEDDDDESWGVRQGAPVNGSMTTRPAMQSAPKRNTLSVPPATERRHHTSSTHESSGKRPPGRSGEKPRSSAADDASESGDTLSSDSDKASEQKGPKRSSSSSSLLPTPAPPPSSAPHAGRASPNMSRRGGQRREQDDGSSHDSERRSEKRKGRKKGGSEILFSSGRDRTSSHAHHGSSSSSSRDKAERSSGRSSNKDRASTASIIVTSAGISVSESTNRDRKQERKQMYAALVGVDRRGEKRRKPSETESAMTIRRSGVGAAPVSSKDRSGTGNSRVPALNLAVRPEHSSSTLRYRSGAGTHRPSSSTESSTPPPYDVSERRVGKEKLRSSGNAAREKELRP